jgi:hypothetical protein
VTFNLVAAATGKTTIAVITLETLGTARIEEAMNYLAAVKGAATEARASAAVVHLPAFFQERAAITNDHVVLRGLAGTHSNVSAQWYSLLAAAVHRV